MELYDGAAEVNLTQRQIRAALSICAMVDPMMKQGGIALFLFFAISGNSGAQTTSPSTAHPQTVRVAFWNIQWFPGRHPNASVASERSQIASVHRDMRRIYADVIGMEEVRDFDNATIAVSPLAGFKVDVVSDFPPREGQDVGQQVAIASRLPPLSAWVEMWKPNGALVPPRGFAFAAYEFAPRHILLVYGVHLKSNRGEIAEDIAIREESMQQLTAHMQAMNDAYGKLGTVSCIVGGDFNTAPDDPRFAGETTTRTLLDNGFSWCWQNIPFAQRISLPADKLFPAACFDHIFVRNAKIDSARVIETSRRSSDHNAIFAELEL
jgi:endonuclease/exonuclease/phosphatase family metal-dependent hydrolase